MSVKITVEGLSQLEQNLTYLRDSIARRIVRAALSRAMTPALRSIRSATYTTVARRTGLLQRGLKTRGIKVPQPGGRFAAGVFAATATKAFIGKLRTTGALRTYVRKGRGPLKIGAGTIGEVTKPFYWKFIEFGTRRMKARPYVARAFESAAPTMLETYREAVSTGIERAVAQRPNK